MKKVSTFKILSRVLFLILIPVAVSYLLKTLIPIPAFSLDKQAIISYLSSFKGWAPVIYIALQTVTIPLVPVPSVILATVAGIIFDFKIAVLCTTLAWVLGTTINFFLARLLGRSFLEKMLSFEEMSQVDKFAKNIGWKLIFITWFIPGGMADVAGYAAGLTEMLYKKYLLSATLAAFILAIFTSAAGATISVNSLLATIFTLGALIGILTGFKVIVIYSILRRILKRLSLRKEGDK